MNLLTCNSCEFETNDAALLAVHYCYGCTFCNTKFCTVEALHKHVCGKVYFCSTCGIAFNSYQNQLDHECQGANTLLARGTEVEVNDPINPSHYKSSGAHCTCGRTIECIDIARWWQYNLGNVLKYLWRADHKGDRQEQLKKAHWYLRDEIRRGEPDFDANA